MFKRQFEHYKVIYQEALSITKESELFCKKLKSEDELRHVSSMRHYVLPMIFLITLTIFVGYYINDKNPRLEFAILKSIFSCLSLIAGYIGSVYLCKMSSGRWFNFEMTQRQSETIIGYGSTTLFALQIILAFFPGFFFLNILALHTLYLLWCFSSEYVVIEERFRTYFMIFNTASMVVLPLIARKIFQLLIPNVSI